MTLTLLWQRPPKPAAEDRNGAVANALEQRPPETAAEDHNHLLKCEKWSEMTQRLPQTAAENCNEASGW